jgi:hypothetical protein
MSARVLRLAAHGVISTNRAALHCQLIQKNVYTLALECCQSQHMVWSAQSGSNAQPIDTKKCERMFGRVLRFAAHGVISNNRAAMHCQSTQKSVYACMAECCDWQHMVSSTQPGSNALPIDTKLRVHMSAGVLRWAVHHVISTNRAVMHCQCIQKVCTHVRPCAAIGTACCHQHQPGPHHVLPIAALGSTSINNFVYQLAVHSYRLC